MDTNTDDKLRGKIIIHHPYFSYHDVRKHIYHISGIEYVRLKECEIVSFACKCDLFDVY